MMSKAHKVYEYRLIPFWGVGVGLAVYLTFLVMVFKDLNRDCLRDTAYCSAGDYIEPLIIFSLFVVFGGIMLIGAIKMTSLERNTIVLCDHSLTLPPQGPFSTERIKLDFDIIQNVQVRPPISKKIYYEVVISTLGKHKKISVLFLPKDKEMFFDLFEDLSTRMKKEIHFI